MTVSESPEPHDSRHCGARKRQPRHPGETCARPAGWGTWHVGYGRCKLHGGATPYRTGRYSSVVRQFILPELRWKFRRYTLDTLMSSLVVLIPDPDRRAEIRRMLLAETGLNHEEEMDRG